MSDTDRLLVALGGLMIWLNPRFGGWFLALVIVAPLALRLLEGR